MFSQSTMGTQTDEEHKDVTHLKQQLPVYNLKTKVLFVILSLFTFLNVFFLPFFSLFTLCNKQDNLQSKKKNRPRWATDSVLSDLQNVNVPLNKTNPHQSLDRLDFSQTYQRSYRIIDSENSDSQNML